MTEHGGPMAVSGSKTINSTPDKDLRLKILRVCAPRRKGSLPGGAPHVRAASTRPGRLFIEIQETRAVV
jgi:hypothetical protein